MHLYNFFAMPSEFFIIGTLVFHIMQFISGVIEGGFSIMIPFSLHEGLVRVDSFTLFSLSR